MGGLILLRQTVVDWCGENFSWYFVAHCHLTDRHGSGVLKIFPPTIFLIRTVILTVWSHLLQVGLQLGLVILALLALSLGPLHWNIFSIGPLNVIAVRGGKGRELKGREGKGREGFTIKLTFFMLSYKARSSVVNDLFSIFSIFKIQIQSLGIQRPVQQHHNDNVESQFITIYHI